MISRRLARVLTFGAFERASPQHLITVTVDGVSQSFTANDSSTWQETWLPGTVDWWVAHRKVTGGYQVEWEASTRAPIASVGSIAIAVPGLAVNTVAVNRQWPAGRRLCGRLGTELDLWDPWQRPGGYRERNGPLEIPLPSIPDAAAQPAWSLANLTTLRASLSARTTCQIEGYEDGIQAWDGPWPSWGNPASIGAPGGTSIYFLDAWHDCVEYARLAAEIGATAMMRQWCFYNADGTLVTPDQYTEANQPYCDIEALVKPTSFAGTDTLHNCLSTSHYIRIGRRLVTAYEMTGSPLAKRHLLSMAALGRLTFSEKGPLATLELGSGWIAFNLISFENRSIAVGSNGRLSSLFGEMGWDRHHGWIMWFAAEAKKIGMEWTAGWQDWATRFIACINRNQMANGLAARVNRGDVDAGLVDIAPAMHQAIIGMGMLALSKQTGIAVPGFELNHAKTLYRTDSLKQGYYGQVGPFHFIQVGTVGAAPENPVTTGWPEPSLPGQPGDPSHNEAYLAAMYFRSGDTRWLNDSLEYGVPQATLAAKKAYMLSLTNSSNVDDRNWVMPLLAAYQQAGI